MSNVPIPHVRVLWRPEQYNRVSNPGFEGNSTAGWVTTAGINAAATSIATDTTSEHSGTYCAYVVTSAVDASGVNFDFGAIAFFGEAVYGTTYAALVWLKRVAGSHQARITLGSLGTPDDRATLLITDLPDSWTPYRVLWMPSATRQDVELAVTNGSASVLQFLVDDVNVYQVDAFSVLENSTFPADASGWQVTASLNAAGTSITRSSGDPFAVGAGTGYATLVTTATNGSGCHYSVGGKLFTSNRLYRLRVALKSVSGTTSAKIQLGSVAGSQTSKAITLTTSWAWYFVDWTPGTDRTDVEVDIMNGTAAVMTARMTSIEVYEAIDEINGDGGRADVSHMDWSRGIDGSPGTLNLVVYDPRDARRYTPWATTGALYGMLEPGRKVWARATYADGVQGEGLYPVSFGTIRRIVPDATTGQAQILCEDPMYDIGRGRTSRPFRADLSYYQARGELFGVEASEPVGGDRRYGGTAANQEEGTFYDGTNGEMGALDYLEQLNEATGSVHYIKPDAQAEVLWRYVTDTRSDLANAASSDETIDDDFHALTGTDMTDEALENSQVVPWQAYEQLATNLYPLVQAQDPTVYVPDDDDPYLHFLDDRWGTDENIPEPTYEKHWRWTIRYWVHHGAHGKTRRGRKKTRVKTAFFRRVYPDAFVPFTLVAGVRKTVTIDWAIPVGGVSLFMDTLGAAPTVSITGTPRQSIIDIIGTTSDTCTSFAVYGTPWLPLDEGEEESFAYDSALDAGTRDGPSFSTPYIGSAGLAQGLADYRNWRYSTSRMRPTLSVEHRYQSILRRNPTEHLTINAALFSLSGSVFVINSLSGSADMGARMWAMDYTLEELPASLGTLFTIGTSALDGAAVLAY